MIIHRLFPLTDGRKRVHKVYPKGVERVEFPSMHIATPLGIWVRTLFWHDMDAHFDALGGMACGWTRNFAEQHVTEEVCAGLVERRFPGFVSAGNALLVDIKGRPLKRSERVEFKCYRYAWSGFHDQREQSKIFRFGPGCGPRYWKNNKRLREHMLKVSRVLLARGPSLHFQYDINHPELEPVPL